MSKDGSTHSKNSGQVSSPQDRGFFRPDEVLGERLKDTPEALAMILADYIAKLNDPGQYPLTRGIHPTMYRVQDGGRKPTIRQFAGHGLAPDTNERFRKILELGGNGLSTAFDLPTLYGDDSNATLSRWEVGWDGVAIDTLQDMEDLFRDISIDEVTVSMTINAPAAVILAMYVAMAQKRGISLDQLGGTLQNDILKEYIAQNESVFPVDKGVKLVTDTIEYCARYMPRWNTVSISGYHIREAGSTAIQELAYTIADGIWYVTKAIERGVPVEEFAPRLSFFFDVHNDFFEEIAKFRAARRLWAEIMRDRFGAQNPRSQWCRIHAQTAGCTLTRKQPMNNIIRVAYQALAALLGGAQSIHTNSYDEVIATPTEKALKIAIRTQQILLEETEVPNWVDPLGGSWLLEHLTEEIYEGAKREIALIDEYGGMEGALAESYPQRMIHRSAILDQRRVEGGERKIVGVNIYRENENPEEMELAELLREIELRRGFEERQKERLAQVKRERSAEDVRRALDEVRRAASTGENMMPPLIEAVKTYATLGEICGALRKVWGEYAQPQDFSSSLTHEEAKRITQGYVFPKPTRILLAKAGHDGHTRGLYIFKDLFRAMGAEVIYLGLRCTPGAIAKAAVEEDVNIVGLSALIGFSPGFFQDLKEELRRLGRDDIIIVGGGLMLPEHYRFIREQLGIQGIFLPDTSLQEVIEAVKREMGNDSR